MFRFYSTFTITTVTTITSHYKTILWHIKNQITYKHTLSKHILKQKFHMVPVATNHILYYTCTVTRANIAMLFNVLIPAVVIDSM